MRRLLVAALESQQKGGGTGTTCQTVHALLAGLQPSNFRAAQLHLRLLLDQQVNAPIRRCRARTEFDNIDHFCTGQRCQRQDVVCTLLLFSYDVLCQDAS